MKAMFLAAAAVIASPLLAQTGSGGTATPMNSSPTQGSTTSPTDPSGQTMPTDPATSPDASSGQTMQNDPSMPPQTTGSQTGSQGSMSGMNSSGSMGSTGSGMGGSGMDTPAGGYQPSQSALSGAAQPGVQPRFQAAQSPDQAYPAPQPLAKYPVCKKGQYDKCIQRGGR